MKSVSFTDRLYSIETTQRYGNPNGLGYITFGASYFGEDNEMAGIYQRRIASKFTFDHANAQLGLMTLAYNKLGSPNFKKTDNQNNHKIICRMRHYVTPNPQTDPQQDWRNYFATVLLNWQIMSDDDKNIWRKKSYPAHMSGWNRYARKYLKSLELQNNLPIFL